MYTCPEACCICWKSLLLLLYKAAVKLQIKGPCHRLLMNLLVPTALYEFFIIPKQCSMNALLVLNVLKNDLNWIGNAQYMKNYLKQHWNYTFKITYCHNVPGTCCWLARDKTKIGGACSKPWSAIICNPWGKTGKVILLQVFRTFWLLMMC